MTKLERTEAGNTIKRGFRCDGMLGTEYNTMEMLRQRGFRTLFCDAPYRWCMIKYGAGTYNKIYMYCEGDVTTVTCKGLKRFWNEVKRYILFERENQRKSINEIKEMCNIAGIEVEAC